MTKEHGYLVIRDEERSTVPIILPVWLTSTQLDTSASGLASHAPPAAAPHPKTRPFQKSARFINFDKSHKKEQGLFLYQDPDSGLALQLPLIGSGEQGKDTSDYLAFPCTRHLRLACRQVLADYDSGTHHDKVIVPAFYGKKHTVSMPTTIPCL